MQVWIGVLAAIWGGAAAAEGLVQFQSPSGNIHCMMLDASGEWRGTRCDIMEGTRSFAVPPEDCDLDWGHAFEVPSGGAAGPVCAGDTVADPGAAILGYGASITHGGVTCTVERNGVTCANAAGRGFMISRSGQSLF
jgi:hypothetical protein